MARASATYVVESGSTSSLVKPKTVKLVPYLQLLCLAFSFKKTSVKPAACVIAAWSEDQKVPSLSFNQDMLVNKM